MVQRTLSLKLDLMYMLMAGNYATVQNDVIMNTLMAGSETNFGEHPT